MGMPPAWMWLAPCLVGLFQADLSVCNVSVRCQGLQSQAARANMDKSNMVTVLQAMDTAPSDSKADGSAVSASTGGLLSSQHTDLAIAPCCYK